ncbi:MAG: NAD(P)-binding domain-containing protein, partial [Pseudomonadota bacterium]
MTHLGLIGIGVMGSELAQNFAEKGHDLSLLDRSAEKMEAVLDTAKAQNLPGKLTAFVDMSAFVASLKTPRSIMVLVPSGDPLDQVIAGLRPLLAPGDVLAGVLADGSVFIFPQDREFINIFGAITLEPASPPPADPMPQDLPVGGLRPGQSLTLGPGQTTPDDYRVLRGSLTIDGGSTGDDLMLIGDLTLLSGETGRWLSVCAGSTVRIDGGALGFGFDVADSVLISSGSDGGGASVRGNSTATFSGGKLFERAEYAETVPVRLIGGEFFVDGVPAT